MLLHKTAHVLQAVCRSSRPIWLQRPLQLSISFPLALRDPWVHAKFGRQQGRLPGECEIRIKRRDCTGFASAAAAAGDGLPQPARSHFFYRWLVRLLKGLAISTALAALFVALLPSIISSPCWRGRLLGVGNRCLPAQISVGQASMGWQKPVALHNISVMEPAELGGAQLTTVKKITSTKPLWDMLRGHDYDLIVEEPFVDYSILPSGQTRWQRLPWGRAERARYVSASEAELSARSGVQSHPVNVDHPDRKAPTPKPAIAHGHASMTFSAEGKYFNAQIYIADGSVQVPQEVLEVVGDDLHLTAILGKENIQSEASDMVLDAASILDSAAEHSGAPLAVQLTSSHLGAELSGWKIGNNVTLREPATAYVDFTPALGRYCLSRVSPLLADVVALEEGDRIAVSAIPTNMQLPSDSCDLRLQPLKLKLGRGQLLGRALDLLQLRDKGLDKKNLQAWTSAVHVHVTRTGTVTTHRLDFLIGSPSSNRGVRLVMWGKYDAEGECMDMVLGLPAETLARIGLTGLPDDAVLPIKVGGDAQNVNVDWTGIYKRIAALNLQRVKPGTEGSKSLKGAFFKDITNALASRGTADSEQNLSKLPELKETVPWEEAQLQKLEHNNAAD